MAEAARACPVPADVENTPEAWEQARQWPNLPMDATPIIPVDPFRCEVCGFVARSKAGKLVHLRKKHGRSKRK